MRTETMYYFYSKKWSVPLEIMEQYVGEMDAESFAIAAFGKDARLIQLTVADAANAANMLEVLLGDRNEERTDYIFQNVDFTVVDGE